MKSTLIYIISFFTVLLVVLFLYIKSIIDSIQFDFKIDDVFLSNLNWKSIVNNNSFIELRVLFLLKLISLTNIKVKDIDLKVYYNNSLVGYSSNNQLNKKEETIISDKVNEIYHYFSVNINPNLLELIGKIKGKLNYVIDYELSLKILGIKIKYKSSYENS